MFAGSGKEDVIITGMELSGVFIIRWKGPTVFLGNSIMGLYQEGCAFSITVIILCA